MTAPVMKLAAGEASSSASPLISAGSAIRPSGTAAANRAAHRGLAVKPSARDVGQERSRRDGIDPHIVGRELDGGVPHQVDDGGLGRDIAVADQRVRAQARDRGSGDNAAAALPLHVGGGQADGHEGRRKVHIDRAPEQGEIHRLDRAVR